MRVSDDGRIVYAVYDAKTIESASDHNSFLNQCFQMLGQRINDIFIVYLINDAYVLHSK